MQPIYRTNPFVTKEGNGRGKSNAYIAGTGIDVGADIFQRGLCLPSDNKMTAAQQDRIIEIIHKCFQITIILQRINNGESLSICIIYVDNLNFNTWSSDNMTN